MAERKPQPPRTWPQKFLAAYARCGVIGQAARAARVTRRAVELKRAGDPVFAEAMLAAQKEAGDRFEQEAIRRATRGTLKPVFYQGQRCGLIREYSDTLLLAVLKAKKPDEYRERVTTSQEGPTALQAFDRIAFEDQGPEPMDPDPRQGQGQGDGGADLAD